MIEVLVDTKPDSFPNTLNLKSKGNIPVANLTTANSDTTNVASASLGFGRSEVEIVRSHGYIDNADGDGDNDLMLHFATQESSIGCKDPLLTPSGETNAGVSILGSDSVVIVKCPLYRS